MSVDDCHFPLAKCVKPATTERVADARVLPASEGESVVINQGIVHPHLTSFDFFHGPHGFGEFGGKDVGVETELGAICQIDRAWKFFALQMAATGPNSSSLKIGMSGVIPVKTALGNGVVNEMNHLVAGGMGNKRADCIFSEAIADSQGLRAAN